MRLSPARSLGQILSFESQHGYAYLPSCSEHLKRRSYPDDRSPSPQRPHPSNPTLPVWQALNAAVGQLAVWIERHRQRRELLALSDHMLKDLGISRADAHDESSKRFWQD